MAMELQAPKGTKDMLPEDAYKWQYVENTFRSSKNLWNKRNQNSGV